METKGFIQFEIIINVLALSDSFEYLCYGSTAITNIFNSVSAGIVFIREHLPYKDETPDSDV